MTVVIILGKIRNVVFADTTFDKEYVIIIGANKIFPRVQSQAQPSCIIVYNNYASRCETATGFFLDRTEGRQGEGKEMFPAISALVGIFASKENSWAKSHRRGIRANLPARN